MSNKNLKIGWLSAESKYINVGLRPVHSQIKLHPERFENLDLEKTNFEIKGFQSAFSAIIVEERALVGLGTRLGGEHNVDPLKDALAWIDSLRSSGIVAVIAMGADLHDLSWAPSDVNLSNKEQIHGSGCHLTNAPHGPTYPERLAQSFDALAWPFEKGAVGLEYVPTNRLDSWMFHSVDPLVTWNYLIKLFPRRIELHFPARLSAVENVSKSVNRPGKRDFHYELSVVGARYASREIALTCAKRCGLAVAPFRHLDRLALGAALILPGGRANTNKSVNSLRRWNQNFCVSSSRFSFTCGSGFRYPVKKFFEIPSCGSILVSEGFVGAQHCGFVDGVTFIDSPPEEICSVVSSQVVEKITDQIICSAKSEMARLHSPAARLEQIQLSVERLLKNELLVAEFHDGRFECR